jgi:hypothetical protein
MRVTVVVHEIEQPMVPHGWRWAVHVHEISLDARDMRSCVNAGWCPSRAEACMEGEMVGVACAKAVRHAGVDVVYGLRCLDDDPTLDVEVR